MDTIQRRKLEKQKKLEEQIVQEQQLTYQVVLDYLLEEGFASTEKSADSIILNMSEAWFQHIIDEDDKSYDKRAAQRAAARARDLKMFFEPEGDEIDEATYPSDFKKGSGVAKKKYGRPIQHDQPMKGAVRKTVDEETEDSLKDKRMERGGVDGNTRYDRPARSGGSQPNTFGKKKPKYDGMSAVEKVKAAIENQYGKGAIVDTKKKKK